MFSPTAWQNVGPAHDTDDKKPPTPVVSVGVVCKVQLDPFHTSEKGVPFELVFVFPTAMHHVALTHCMPVAWVTAGDPLAAGVMAAIGDHVVPFH
jgi:hypothetical protein